MRCADCSVSLPPEPIGSGNLIGDPLRVHFCPLHAAAPALVEALGRFVMGQRCQRLDYATGRGCLSPHDLGACPVSHARAALRAAGKDV